MRLYINPFKLGCDPEFVVVNEDSLITVGNILPGGLGRVSYDHGGLCVEIRPKPSYHVSDVIKDIYEILTGPELQPLRPFKWLGGGYAQMPKTVTLFSDGQLAPHDQFGERRVYIGGHVHIELPYRDFHNTDTYAFNDRVESYDFFVKTLESVGIIHREQAIARRTVWGKFGETQVAHNNSNDPGKVFYRTEYRTPYSWMTDPRHAMIVMTGIKLASVAPLFANEVFNKFRESNQLDNFEKLVYFFRKFQAFDADAKLVAKRILKDKKPETLANLKANPERNFQETWNEYAAQCAEA